MIPVGGNEILSHFAGIPEVLYTFHKSYPTITRGKFHPVKTESLFCTAGIPLCPDKIFQCSRFSPPKRDEKAI